MASTDSHAKSGLIAGRGTTLIPVCACVTLKRSLSSSFRKQALKWHPDKNAGSQDAAKRFIKIQAAYDV